MARPRTVRVRLAEFFADRPDWGRWTEFDPDEFVECINFGSLPRTITEDSRQLTRDMAALEAMRHDNPKRKEREDEVERRQTELRAIERVRLIKDWLVRDPDTQQPYPLPEWHEGAKGETIIDLDPFARMDMNLERMIMHAVYSAFEQREEAKRTLGEDLPSETPSEEKLAIPTSTPSSLRSVGSRSRSKATSAQAIA